MKIQNKHGQTIKVRPILGQALIRMGRAIAAEDEPSAELPAEGDTQEAAPPEVSEQPRQKRKYTRRDMKAE